jgi:hypothetical protein
MMKAVPACQTSIHFYQSTLRHIPEGFHLHIRRHENFKSHFKMFGFFCRRHQTITVVTFHEMHSCKMFNGPRSVRPSSHSDQEVLECNHVFHICPAQVLSTDHELIPAGCKRP